MSEVAAVEATEKDDNGAIKSVYKKKYGKDKHCGDEIAILMKAFCLGEKGKIDPEKMVEIAEANGLSMDKWSHLNVGMQRLSLGNVLRGILRKGTDVEIGDDTIEGEEQE